MAQAKASKEERDDGGNERDIPGEKRLECICPFASDQGKLVITDAVLSFRSLHYDKLFPLSDITSAKKSSKGKVALRLNNSETLLFGPFPPETKRKTVLRALQCDAAASSETANGEEDDAGAANVNVDLSKLKGYDAKDLPEMLKIQPPCSDHFGDADPKKDKAALNFTVPVPLLAVMGMCVSAESDLGDKVLESDANEDLSGTPWVVSPDNTHWVRTLKMTKRSSLVTCHVTQTQRFRMISETEAAFETSSATEGVPLTSPGQFTAEGKWKYVESNGVTRIRSWCRVDWHKKPGLVTPKGAIDKGAIEGFGVYFEAYRKAVLKEIAAAGGGDAIAEVENEISNEDSPVALLSSDEGSSSPFAVNMLTIILGGVLVLLFFLLLVTWWSRSGWSALAVQQELEIEDLHERIEIMEAQLLNLGQVMLDSMESPAGPPAELVTKIRKQWLDRLNEAENLLESLRNDFDSGVLIVLDEEEEHEVDGNNAVDPDESGSIQAHEEDVVSAQNEASNVTTKSVSERVVGVESRADAVTHEEDVI